MPCVQIVSSSTHGDRQLFEHQCTARNWHSHLKSHLSSHGTLPIRKSAIAGGEELPMANENEVEEDNFVDDDNDVVPVVFVDEDFPDNVEVKDASESKREED